MNSKGFTLVELVIVIAIIGMLAVIVMADLRTAKIKAADVVVRQNLNSLKAQGGLYYDENNTYTDLCSASNVVRALEGSKDAVGNPYNCDSNDSSWAAEIQISTGDYYCVDSEGNASTTVASKGAATIVCF